MGEYRSNFLHMMRDEQERRRTPTTTEGFEESQKMYAGDGIQSRTWFIKNQERRIGHQGAADEHPLAFPL